MSKTWAFETRSSWNEDCSGEETTNYQWSKICWRRHHQYITRPRACPSHHRFINKPAQPIQKWAIVGLGNLWDSIAGDDSHRHPKYPTPSRAHLTTSALTVCSWSRIPGHIIGWWRESKGKGYDMRSGNRELSPWNWFEHSMEWSSGRKRNFSLVLEVLSFVLFVCCFYRMFF